MLDRSLIEQGKLEPNLFWTNLIDEINETIEMMMYQGQAKKIKI